MQTYQATREVKTTTKEVVELPIPSYWACHYSDMVYAVTPNGFIVVTPPREDKDGFLTANISLRPDLYSHEVLGGQIDREQFLDKYTKAHTAIDTLADTIAKGVGLEMLLTEKV